MQKHQETAHNEKDNKESDRDEDEDKEEDQNDDNSKVKPFEIIRTERSDIAIEKIKPQSESTTKVYVNSEEIKTRLEQSKEITKCHICKVKFEFQHMLERHYVKIHEVVPIYSWNLCKCPFFILNSFKDHLKFHKFTSSKIKLKSKRRKRRSENYENDPPKELSKSRSGSSSQERSSKSQSPPRILKSDTYSQLEEKGIKVDLRKKEFKHLKKKKSSHAKKEDSDFELPPKKREIKAESKENLDHDSNSPKNEKLVNLQKESDNNHNPETEVQGEPKKKRRRRRKKQIVEQSEIQPEVIVKSNQNSEQSPPQPIDTLPKKKEKVVEIESNSDEAQDIKKKKKKRSKSEKKRLKEIAIMDINQVKKEAKLLMKRMKELMNDDHNEMSVEPTNDTCEKSTIRKETEVETEQIENFNEFAGPSHCLDGAYWQLLSLI